MGNETLASNACTSSVGAESCEVITLDGDMIILDEDGDGYMPVVCEAEDGSELINADIDCDVDNNFDRDYDDGVCEYNNVDPDDVPELITISCTSSVVSCETELIIDEGFL
ncbi:hypothetical protein KKG31_08325 [Patescibacteria group bacterium]|nr:hypothetical protein [Patescibacteria group bacterium]MBU1759062.1 hypothetical protein [Patescibacteria group bacterium]